MDEELAAYQNAVELAKVRIARLTDDLEAQRRLLTAAYHALQSYAHGNSAPELAAEVAEQIEATIKKV